MIMRESRNPIYQGQRGRRIKSIVSSVDEGDGHDGFFFFFCQGPRVRCCLVDGDLREGGVHAANSSWLLGCCHGASDANKNVLFLVCFVYFRY